MNSIHGIIHDLAEEETIIGGCTTAGEVIIALQSLVEQNNSLKERLKKIEQIVNNWNNDASHSFEDMCKINKILKENSYGRVYKHKRCGRINKICNRR